MASRMVTSYGPQAAQANEELPSKSFLNLTLTQHPRDKELKPRAWYYCISPNSCTLVILLQVDPTFGDELETIYEGCYETKDTSIFAWFSVPDIGHYRWLCDPIHRLPPNSKVNYLIRTIQHILDFLQL
jgi:hypothetical protein